MIDTKLGHIQFNVHAHNLPFYKDLFAFFGWPTLEDDGVMFGTGKDIFHSFWFFGCAKETANDYDGPGMNHLGLLVQTQGEVDQMVAYLREQRVTSLFDTPRHRPEFAYDLEHTYYQVMFASPPRLCGITINFISRQTHVQ